MGPCPEASWSRVGTGLYQLVPQASSSPSGNLWLSLQQVGLLIPSGWWGSSERAHKSPSTAPPAGSAQYVVNSSFPLSTWKWEVRVLTRSPSGPGLLPWGVLSLTVRQTRLTKPFLEMISQGQGLTSTEGPEAVALETAECPPLWVLSWV